MWGTIVDQHTTVIYILPIWVQWLSFPYSLKQQCWIQRYRASLSLVYFLLDSTSHGTNTGMPGSGYTAPLRHFLYKDCFSLNCEKLLLVRGEQSFPPAESKRAHRVPRWPSLCECWAVEVLKKCQVSYEFKWWMFFFMSSARKRTKYLQRSRERLVSVLRNRRYFFLYGSFDMPVWQ